MLNRMEASLTLKLGSFLRASSANWIFFAVSMALPVDFVIEAKSCPNLEGWWWRNNRLNNSSFGGGGEFCLVKCGARAKVGLETSMHHNGELVVCNRMMSK